MKNKEDIYSQYSFCEEKVKNKIKELEESITLLRKTDLYKKAYKKACSIETYLDDLIEEADNQFHDFIRTIDQLIK